MEIAGDFEEILLNEKIGCKIVEKLAGNTPKPALMFYQYFKEKLDYKILNLGDSSEAYFERAETFADCWNLDPEGFADRVPYFSNVNVYRSKVSDFAQELDAIVYWGAAAKCLQAFDDEREKKYLECIGQEREKGKKLGLGAVEIHENIRKHSREEWFVPITDDELKKVFMDDISALKQGGVIITNHAKDTGQIREVLSGLGLKATDYFLEKPFGLIEYERNLTVWRPF
ncbi:MAG: hypothetical protein ABIB71_03440 [Candidatus Woesearchaeota archaeon]